MAPSDVFLVSSCDKLHNAEAHLLPEGPQVAGGQPSTAKRVLGQLQRWVSLQPWDVSRTLTPMNSEYTAVLKQDDGWWIGWIEEVPGVNCQERTKEALLRSLREVLSEALEFNRQEARNAAGGEFSEEPLAL